MYLLRKKELLLSNMKKKVTLTIAIPAYNEEANIELLLLSLLKQKHANFLLKKIVVYTDASADNTPAIVKRLMKKSSIIQLKEGKGRKGKYFRVNQMFHACTTDIIVVLDADIAPGGDHFLEKLVDAMIADPKAQLVAAHQILIRPTGFIPKVIHTSFVMWDFVRLSIPQYDSALNYFGSATAYRGSFARSVYIPKDLLDPHLYIYLAAKKLNGFRYCLSAEILQVPITTIRDLQKFLRRSIGKRDKKLEQLFDIKIADIYFIPRKNKIIGIMKAFLWQPFYTPLALILSFIMAKKAKSIVADKTPVWDIVTSTKKPILTQKENK